MAAIKYSEDSGYTLKQSKEVSNYPTSYMDNDGVMYEWKAGDENDAYLRYLIRDYNDSYYLKYRVPFAMNVNFKVTKKLFDEKLNVALFCNKLLDLNLFLPDSTQRGIIVEIKYIMHSILYHLDGRTWETFQKEIAAN